MLIVGGEDHQTGNFSSRLNDIEKRYSELESWTKDRFPVEEIEYKWSGQVMEPQDSIAFIGHNPGDNGNNIYIATGDSGNGITHGTIAGILLTDLILGKSNPWAAIYDPSRSQEKNLARNVGGDVDKHNMKQKIHPINKVSKKMTEGHLLKVKKRRSHLLKI